MPTTLTLKNIPDEVYVRLRAAADANHRSLNSEVLVYLERALLPTKVPVSERLARARNIRDSLVHAKVTPGRIDAAKREGRP